jgi:arylsulfatase A-like enzyme
MKVIFILFDTLNKHFLPPYGNNWVHAPNFKKLAEKTVIFDNCYCGSLMCIPARRELHTGRNNFLHRSWGPMEPFDDSMPEILKNNGVYSHLVSDHYHYWEDGGCTYHNRYSSWEIVRGHEGDPWKGEVKDPDIPETIPNMRRNWPHWRQDWVNRKYMQKEEDQPQAETFKLALEFIDKNNMENDWFLHIETFDPHEPYFTQQKYKNIYKHEYNGPHFDWPNYGIVTETKEQVEHIRKEYAASISMCDTYLGKILDLMDEKDMWKDTMLIITTDHGFLLGEKDWWAKGVQPIYNEIAQIPLFIWDPRSAKKNERREALVQTTDIVPTSSKRNH